jgi:hypothetical protein
MKLTKSVRRCKASVANLTMEEIGREQKVSIRMINMK